MGLKKQESATENGVEKYELRAPDGGWGYVVVLATVMMFCSTIIPMTGFGLIFGNFLKTIGDETTGTALMNGMFNTVSSFTGLIANGVLNRYSYRKVGIAGTVIYIIGAIGVVFSNNLYALITFFGVIQGFGFGLMMPAVYSAFNLYFHEKMAVMMSIAQAMMVTSAMLLPQVATWSMTTLGFRGTLIALVVLAILCLPAMASLQPVKWHMKKVLVADSHINDTVLLWTPSLDQMLPEKVSEHIVNGTRKLYSKFTIVPRETVVPIEHPLETKKSPSLHALKSQIEPLLISQEKHTTASQRSLNERIILPKPRQSIISLGDRAASVSNIHQLRELKHDMKGDISMEDELSIWQSFIKSMDMSLLKDAKYLNISIGLALCFTSDMAFISIIPIVLGNVGFDSTQIALIITIFFGSDLVSRILLTIISGMFKFRSRNIVLFSALFSAIFRTVLVSNDSYIWKMSILGVLGFLRCFIQTPLPLVIAEEYSDQFSTAFSLFMAVNGVISLVFGLLMSFVKSYTQSDVMVCHSLTMALAICVITWTAEMILFRKKSKTHREK